MNATDRLDTTFADPSELRAALVRKHGGAEAYGAYLPFGFDDFGGIKHSVRFNVYRSRSTAWKVAGFAVETWGDVEDVIFG